MSLYVLKFGGTSVGNIERIRRIASRVVSFRRAGHDLAVVVSAMQGETDRLIRLCREITDSPSPREYDVLVSTGEQVSCALLSMAIQKLGVPAESLLAHQIHIHTDEEHSKAEIRQVDADRIKRCIDDGKIAVVAGFQGLNSKDDITTLGRGGSDLTAVAVAITLDAEACRIYTDVKGVYTADPRICPEAELIHYVTYEEMLEMASLGAKVLHARGVKLAMKFKLPIHVLSSFEETEDVGTIVGTEDPDMEHRIVSGITCDKSEAKVTLRRCKDDPSVKAVIFTALAESGIVVDMIVQNVSEDGFVDISFTVPRMDKDRTIELMHSMKEKTGAGDILCNDRVVKVSAVGVGMRGHGGVAARFFSALADTGVPADMVSTSEIKISCMVPEDLADRAVRAIHRAFELGSKEGAFE